MKLISSKVKPWYALTLVVVLAWGIISVLVPMSSGQFINHAMAGGPDLLSPFFWLFLGASAFEIIISTAGTFLNNDLVKRVKNELRQNILTRLFKSQTYQAEQLSAATTDLNVNTEAIAEQYVKGEIDIANCLVMIIASAAGLLAINLMLSAVIIFVSLLIVLFPKLLAKPSQRNRVAKAEAQDRLNNSVNSFLKGIETLNVFGAQRYFQSLALQDNVKLYTTEGKAVRYETSTYGVNSLLEVVKTFVIIAFGAYLITQHTLTIGGLLAAIQIATNVGAPMEVLSMLLYYRREVTPIAERMQGYTEPKAPASQPLNPAKVETITFDHFSLTTPDRPILQDLNLQFEAGKKYLLMGKSGAGKSTLIRAITRVKIGKQTGQLRINGEPTARFANIKLVTQAPAIFNASLADNLFMGQPVDDAKRQQLINLLELDELVERCGENADLVEEDLSGGEKQRLALGRALLTKPDVLLLDEFNSALDARLSQKLETYVLGLPCLIISVMHHLDETLLSRYDDIITLREGRVTGVTVP
ncbi:ATP-binding cassette domain-containing protein [Lacticaseibacillus jixianensis]|uniref:ATP-binding cassette domain-containing protein n=1 Tax=Lacticaseibacillus jixianensis TaxID=2486012 RepID=A0ABW4B9Y5_9LACO|nr:ABC transporter ATP-binding protein [Lacticaseibacillus jixianensis]